MSSRVAPFSLRRRAYDRIRDMLSHGQFPPGSRVSTLDLSKQLGISRTPVREALSQLSSQGLIQEVPGFGMYVQIPERQELEELYGMREILETYAAARAAESITPAEIAQMEVCCDELRALAAHLRTQPSGHLDEKSMSRWLKIDERFHAILLGAARNRLLLKTAKDMRLLSRTLDVRRFEPTHLTLSGAAQTYRQHATLVRALRRHDAALAEFWIRRQLRIGRERHLADIDVFAVHARDVSFGSAAGAEPPLA